MHLHCSGGDLADDRVTVVAARIGRGKSHEWLYLFTTLTLPGEDVLVFYGKRWRIDKPIRSR